MEKFRQLPELVLTHGTIIDGTGAAPLHDAAIVIRNGLIQAIGSDIAPGSDVEIIDVQGRFILPGFFNTHVHRGLKAETLRAWAQEGVTTVRDLGASQRLDQFTRRDKLMQYNRHARLVMVGPMIGPIRGYGSLETTSLENARKAVRALAEAGADLIKIGIEDHINRKYKLISLEEIHAIVEAAHILGLRAAAHVTRTHHLSLAIEAGVDEITHMVRDELSDQLIDHMVQKKMFCIPTLELWSGVSQMLNQNYIRQVTENLQRFVAAGGQVALGTDYAGYGCEFELGMPLKEMKLMQTAGMTPMQIISAGTLNAAKVCGLGGHGTLEPRKNADVLVIDGDPLEDLDTLKNTFLVIHNGERIR